MNEIDVMDIVKIIKEKSYKYYEQYEDLAHYIKMPIWLFEVLKQQMAHLVTMKIDYETGNVKFLGLIVCPTLAISEIKEIEVL